MLNNTKEHPVMRTYKHGCLSSATLVCTVILILHPVTLLHDVSGHQKQQHIELCPFGDRVLTINESISNAAQMSLHHSPLSSLLILSSSCAVLNDFLSFTLPLAMPIHRVHITEKFLQMS
jgi:hypothetical protein